MWKGYLLASALVMSILPYTLTTMERTVNLKLAEEAEKVQAHGEKAEARKVMGLKEESDGVRMSAATVKQLLDEVKFSIKSSHMFLHLPLLSGRL